MASDICTPQTFPCKLILATSIWGEVIKYPKMSLNTDTFRMVKNVYLFILMIILPTAILTFHNRIDQQNVRINQQASKIEELASKLRDLETRIENQRPLTPPMVSCYMKRTISKYNYSRHNNLGCTVQLGNRA